MGELSFQQLDGMLSHCMGVCELKASVPEMHESVCHVKTLLLHMHEAAHEAALP